jgi:hypothetical protein
MFPLFRCHFSCSCFWLSSAAATQLAKSSSFVAAFLPTKEQPPVVISMATTSDQRRGHRIENDGLGRQRQQQPTTAFGLTHHCRNAHRHHTELKFAAIAICLVVPMLGRICPVSAVLFHLYWSLRRYPTNDEPPSIFFSCRSSVFVSFRFGTAAGVTVLQNASHCFFSFDVVAACFVGRAFRSSIRRRQEPGWRPPLSSRTRSTECVPVGVNINIDLQQSIPKIPEWLPRRHYPAINGLPRTLLVLL